MFDFSSKMEYYRELAETALDAAIADKPGLNEIMRYAVLGGGKRLRGVLVLAFRESAGGSAESALPLAIAAELLHAYSLVHDDLPCMDDDDFRRGKPSVHKKFGEWQALLAGDALQALAFKFASGAGKSGNYVKILSEAAFALCEGQYLDLSADSDIETLTLNKTAALFKAACLLGHDDPGAARFGVNFGLTFQIRDDILDRDGYFSRFGEDACLALIERYSSAAISAAPNEFLRELARRFAEIK
jgi:geranylgeranyl pyrophosphate synthase